MSHLPATKRGPAWHREKVPRTFAEGIYPYRYRTRTEPAGKWYGRCFRSRLLQHRWYRELGP